MNIGGDGLGAGIPICLPIQSIHLTHRNSLHHHLIGNLSVVSTMAQIAQIQINHLPVEDRMLLRMATSEGQEYRLWLTRRYVKLLGPILKEIAAGHPIVQAQQDLAARETIAAFEHERAMHGQDFTTPFHEQERALPLGDAPILLSRIEVRDLPDGLKMLRMHPELGLGIDLTLDYRLLHALIAVLDAGLGRSEWDLPTISSPLSLTERDPKVTVN
jgi:hypothetical protein